MNRADPTSNRLTQTLRCELYMCCSEHLRCGTYARCMLCGENDLNLSVCPCVGCGRLPSAAYLLQLKSGPGSAAASPSGTAAERRHVVPKAYQVRSALAQWMMPVCVQLRPDHRSDRWLDFFTVRSSFLLVADKRLCRRAEIFHGADADGTR